MRLELDGRPLQKHSLIRQLNDQDYLAYFYILAGDKHFRNIDPDIKEALALDPTISFYLGNVIEHLAQPPFSPEYISPFCPFANELADYLVKSEDYLELIPKYDPRENLPTLAGYRLNKGIVLYHGNIDRLKAPRGGTYYINGDVNQMEGDTHGVVYINGDLKRLDNTVGTILIVTGKVEEYVQTRDPDGGLGELIYHSPFLFSPELIKGTLRENYKVAEIESGMVVPKEKLSDWHPLDVVNKALELCQEKVALENTRRMAIVQNIKDPKNMIRFYFYDYGGYVEGLSRR